MKPSVGEICGQMPKRKLTALVFEHGAGVVSIFLSFLFFCLAWPGTDHSPAPDTMDHTVGEREREGEKSG